jgi:Tfp pilus assembly protein PilO
VKSNFQKQILKHLAISATGIIILFIILILVKGDVGRRADLAEGLKATLAGHNQATESLIRLKAGEKEASSYLATLKNQLPFEEELINFPKEIIGLAERDKVELGFTFGGRGTEELDQLGSLSFSMSSSGTYDDTLAFLKRIESHRYFISLDSISLTQKSESENLFSGVMSGKIFIRKALEESF